MTTSALYLKLQAENLAARKAKNEDATSALGGLIDATQKLAKSQKKVISARSRTSMFSSPPASKPR